MAKTVFLMEYRENFIQQFEKIIGDSAFTIVGTAPEGEDALKKINALSELPEIAVISLQVAHGLDGVNTLKKIKQEKLGMKVVIVEREHQSP